MRLVILFLLLVFCQVAISQKTGFVELGDNAYARAEYNKAVALYRKALANDPNSANIEFLLGKSLVKTGQTIAGFNFMEQGVLKSPCYSWHYQIATMAKRCRRDELAIAHYHACLRFRHTIAVCEGLMKIFHDKGDGEQENRYLSMKIAIEMTKVRGLSFKSEVEVKSKSREQLEKFLLKELNEEMPPEKAQQTKDTLVVFDLIAPDIDLRQFYVSFMTEQIAGFYNPGTKNLYLIKKEKPQPDIWDQLFGSSQGQENRMVMAHELTHSLQDQHFDLSKLEKNIGENDDRHMAFEALVEGDASLAMFDYQIRPKHLSARETMVLRLTFSAQNLLMEFAGSDLYKSAPLVIRESLLFPYLDGLFFCLALRREAPWANINKSFCKIPPSSEHILHPKKYLEWRDLPQDFALGDLSKMLGESWKQVNNNVMGEATLAMIFREHQVPTAKNIACGWGGDRYSVLKNKQGELALIWLTVWDTKKDAWEFFLGYQKIVERKYPDVKILRKGNKITWEQGGKIGCLELIKKQVRLLENIPTKKMRKMYEKIEAISPFTTN